MKRCCAAGALPVGSTNSGIAGAGRGPGPTRSGIGFAMALLLWCIPGWATAQSSITLPVRITADEASLDDRSGASSYRGNVVVVRGDLRLHADNLTILAPERQPQRIEAEGVPARFESPDSDGYLRVATARRITYSLTDETLQLEGDAEIRTRSGQARGERIDYDLIGGQIEIRGTASERVEITFEPPDS